MCFVHINMAVTTRIFLEIVLMIILGKNVVTKWFYFHGQLSTKFFLLACNNSIDDRKVCIHAVVNTRAILSSNIVTLFVNRERINNAKVITQNVRKRNYGFIIGNMDGFCMIGSMYLPIVGSLGGSICIPNGSFFDAVNAREVFFESPKTSARKVNF